MRLNFRKVSAIATSALLVGMTMGTAMAATYPAPFVSSGSADVAIVYGAGADAMDQAQAGDISTELAKLVTTAGTTSVNEEEAYKLEKSSTKFNLGDYAGNVVSAKITEDNLPSLLADGKYIDNDNDEFDYTQNINFSNTTLQVKMFEDNDYKADTPTVGIAISNGANILNYTLDFTDDPLWEDLTTSDLPLMGKSYYVLSNGTIGDQLTLLDSAESVILEEGETKTLTVNGKTYEATISFVSSSETKLTVNGQTTTSLAEGQTYKLSDGAYLGVKDIMYSSKDTGVSKVEFSIGAGKLKLTDGADVELNEVAISDLSVDFTNTSTELTAIKIIWNADDDLFVTEDSTITMPGFGAVTLSFTGLTYPSEEKIRVEADGDNSVVLKDFPLKDTTETINFLYFNGTNYTLVGKDSDNKLAISGNGVLTFDGDTDDWFVASENDTKDAESYLMRVTSFKNASSKQMATFQYRKDGAWVDVKVDADNTDTITLGSVEFTVTSLDKDTKVAVITASGNTVFNRLYSDEGMEVRLPWINSTAVNITNTTAYSEANACIIGVGTLAAGQLGYNQTVYYNKTGTPTAISSVTCTSHPATYNLNLTEEDRNENLGAGEKIVVTLGSDTNAEVSVTSVDMGVVEGTFTEVGTSKEYRNFAYSELATEAMWDKSADQYALELTYHGEEVVGGVYVSSSEAVTSAGESSLGDVLVTDAEVESVKTKNLIVVGGSCINTVAAQLLGTSGAACGADFTAKAGVGAGQFLIKSYTSPYSNSKIALLVAGYERDDTKSAVTYLNTNKLDVSVGKSYPKDSITYTAVGPQ